MQVKVLLIVETHTRDNIYIATNDDIPSKEINGCPKAVAADILYDITGYKIEPDESGWLIIELADTFYEKDKETAYIVFVCRVPGLPDKLELNIPYKWTEYSLLRDKLERLKGLL